ncbi:MAG: 3'-5' exonuclease [Kiritimatiellae bacterium]|nr:3'-5' exonuclease [Kiritimatiellia bacterium]
MRNPFRRRAPPPSRLLFFDTETDGLPRGRCMPHLVSLAWRLTDEDGFLVSEGARLIRPEGFEIPFSATEVHGISQARALAEGTDEREALEAFAADARQATAYVAHNLAFDEGVLRAAFRRRGLPSPFRLFVRRVCTMEESTRFCAIPGRAGAGFKYPRLGELYRILFSRERRGAHDAAQDVATLARCYFALRKRKVVR